jgi:rhodanese-related sulfurtransferase
MANLDKSAPVYVFCASGGRSGKASAALRQEGFTTIIDLKGGYNKWPK